MATIVTPSLAAGRTERGQRVEMHGFEKWMVNSFSGVYLRWYLLPRLLTLIAPPPTGAGLPPPSNPRGSSVAGPSRELHLGRCHRPGLPGGGVRLRLRAERASPH